MTNTGWLFTLMASAFVLFVLWIALGKFGNIRSAATTRNSEFRTISWIAMMFSAGMGIGLMFFGVSEPLSHLVSPPPGTGAEGNPEAIQNAMATTALSLDAASVGDLCGGRAGHRLRRVPQGPIPVDQARHSNRSSALVRTAAGARSSTCWRSSPRCSGLRRLLGLGALQIRSGLQIVGGLGAAGNGLLIGIIAVLTCAFVLSAVSGVARGIQWLVQLQHGAGPSAGDVRIHRRASGFHPEPDSHLDRQLLQDLAMMSARTGAEGAETETWLGSWTVFYWAWWISWTPFVGMFIARISRGRAIRQFVTGVLLVPSLVSLV